MRNDDFVEHGGVRNTVPIEILGAAMRESSIANIGRRAIMMFWSHAGYILLNCTIYTILRIRRNTAGAASTTGDLSAVTLKDLLRTASWRRRCQ